uniref:Neur_chan_LBD domain-containing protein n=1 Tax=Panagrellus redivivus TaxID=6233 RepID=A0A7E4VS11_PANRE
MTQRRQRSRLLLAFVIFSSIILNFAEDCRSNNALLKEKLRQRNRVSHEPPSEGLLLSLKIQDLRLSSPSTLLIDGFLTKRFQDASLDYSRDRPCDEYAVIRIANASTFDTPKISLMNGEWLSGGDKTQINAVVYQNGTVFETERIAISAPCSPNSTTPFGGLVCRLIWHNLAFSQNEMFVTWAEDVSENPAALEKALQSVADYKVSHLEFKHNSIQKFDRVFDELTFEVVLSKSKTKELLLFYVPQIMFVAIA